MSSFILTVSVDGRTHGEVAVGAASPLVGIDGAGRITTEPSSTTAIVVFAERDGVLYAKGTNDQQPVWSNRVQLPAVWTALAPTARLEVGAALVAARAPSTFAASPVREELTVIGAPGGRASEVAPTSTAPPSGLADRTPSWRALRLHAVVSPPLAPSDDSSSGPRMGWTRTDSHPSIAPQPSTVKGGAATASAKPAPRWIRVAGLSVAAVLLVFIVARARVKYTHGEGSVASGDGETTAAESQAPSRPSPIVTAATTTVAPAPSFAAQAPTAAQVAPGSGNKEASAGGSPLVAPTIVSPSTKLDKKAAALAAAHLTPEAAGERAVAEAMFAGDYQRALVACDTLTTPHPELPRYGIMARVLRSKVARTHR